MTNSARCGIAIILLMCAVGTVAFAQDNSTLSDGKVHFQLLPYLMVPGMSGDVTANGETHALNASAGDIFGHLQFGFMGRTEISYNRWFAGTDTVYMGLGGANDSVDAGFDQWAAELLGGRRVHSHIAILGGVRYNSLSTNIKFKGPLATNVRTAQVWWDPFFGGIGDIPLGKKLSASTRLDIGGFGAGSRIAINAEPLLNYKMNKRLTATFGWKFLYQDYVNRGDRFEYDVLTQGPVIGMAIRW